jgi:hypothetical protein
VDESLFRSAKARKLISEKTNQVIINEILRTGSIKKGLDRSP